MPAPEPVEPAPAAMARAGASRVVPLSRMAEAIVLAPSAAALAGPA